jgi:hypothetical protein
MLLCAATLTALLVMNKILDLVWRLKTVCTYCVVGERNLKSGTQWDMCGRWFHHSCGNVKVQMADGGKCSCDRCRWDRLRRLEEKLENALQQIEELKRKKKGLEEQL